MKLRGPGKSLMIPSSKEQIDLGAFPKAEEAKAEEAEAERAKEFYEDASGSRTESILTTSGSDSALNKEDPEEDYGSSRSSETAADVHVSSSSDLGSEEAELRRREARTSF